MEALTVQEIAEAVHGHILQEADSVATAVETDSRTITPGSLFVPLMGERFDGHAYINAALESGAVGCLTQRTRESYLPGKFYIKVDSTRHALHELAAWYRDRFSIPMIGITGSVGKTTTKDMVAAVLRESFPLLKTDGNLNNEIGLPLTVLRLEKTHTLAVLEMGMNHTGEMEQLSRIAQPDVILLTNIGDSHIENFGSREKIFEAKCEIFRHARPHVFSVLNGDDPFLIQLRGQTPGEAVFCGCGDGLDYRASELESDGRSHMTCRVDTPTGSIRMDIPALGEHMIYPVLMATAVGEHFGMPLEKIANGVRKFVPTKMRMNLLNRADHITILDDAYNANPQSMRAAIEVLDSYTGDRKVAVLGDMFELGSLTALLHAGVGKALSRSHVNCLVAIGDSAEQIYDAAKDAVPECYYFASKEEAFPVLREQVRPGTTILVKASRGMAFETITNYLKSITRAEEEEKEENKAKKDEKR